MISYLKPKALVLYWTRKLLEAVFHPAIALLYSLGIPLSRLPLAAPNPSQDVCSVDKESVRHLNELFDEYGSDKGSFHGYGLFYDQILKTTKIDCLLEIGVGTNDPNAPSSMGELGVPGASLRSWRHLLPDAQILGADVDERILFCEEKIVCLWVDQRKRDSLMTLRKQVALQHGAVDVLIDDGLHTIASNIRTFRILWPIVSRSGVYVVEDVSPKSHLVWTTLLMPLRCSWSIVNFPGSSSAVVIRKH